MLGPGDARVDEDEVEAAAGQTRGERVDAFRPVEVHLLNRDPPVGGSHLVGKLGRGCCTARRGGDLPAAAGELACEPKAQTSRRADDDRDLVSVMVRCGGGHGALVARLTRIRQGSLVAELDSSATALRPRSSYVI